MKMHMTKRLREALFGKGMISLKMDERIKK